MKVTYKGTDDDIQVERHINDAGVQIHVQRIPGKKVVCLVEITPGELQLWFDQVLALQQDKMALAIELERQIEEEDRAAQFGPIPPPFEDDPHS